MAYLLATGYALFAISAATLGVPGDGEASISQMSATAPSQAFVEQLPETAVVPVPGSTGHHTRTKRTAPKAVAKPIIPVHSIFPNVGTGANLKMEPAPLRLPTVGGGVTESL